MFVIHISFLTPLGSFPRLASFAVTIQLQSTRYIPRLRLYPSYYSHHRDFIYASGFPDSHCRVSMEAACSSGGRIETRTFGVFAPQPSSLSLPNLILILHTTYCEKMSDECILKVLLSVAGSIKGWSFGDSGGGLFKGTVILI